MVVSLVVINYIQGSKTILESRPNPILKEELPFWKYTGERMFIIYLMNNETSVDSAAKFLLFWDLPFCTLFNVDHNQSLYNEFHSAI